MMIRLLPILVKHRSQFLRFNTVLHQQPKQYKTTRPSSVTKSSQTQVDTNVKPVGEKIKEAAKTTTYFGVIVVGLGLLGALFYTLFDELISSSSPYSIYAKAAERCKADERIQEKLGSTIIVYGMETRRGRRQHVNYVVYRRQDGRQCLRMNFNLKGNFHKGVAHLEMVQNDSGVYEYRYFYVDVDDILRTTIFLEDNRSRFSKVYTTPSTELVS